MECKEPLNKLRSLLLRRGLPADYVSRAVQELADHHADLMEGEPTGEADRTEDAWRRLGNVERLGTELVRKYHARTFSGRHPLVTFVLTPIPAMITFWAATFFLGWAAVLAVAALLGNVASGEPTTDWTTVTDPLPMWSMQIVHYAILAIPPGIVAWWFCRLSRRSGRGLKWAATACVLVLLLAYMVWSELEYPQNGQGGRMLLGIRAPFLQRSDWALLENQGLWKCLLMQFAHLEGQLWQLAAPAAALAYAAWQTRREQRTANEFGDGNQAVA
jgi:hypothetical protein